MKMEKYRKLVYLWQSQNPKEVIEELLKEQKLSTLRWLSYQGSEMS